MAYFTRLSTLFLMVRPRASAIFQVFPWKQCWIKHLKLVWNNGLKTMLRNVQQRVATQKRQRVADLLAVLVRITTTRFECDVPSCVLQERHTNVRFLDHVKLVTRCFGENSMCPLKTSLLNDVFTQNMRWTQCFNSKHPWNPKSPFKTSVASSVFRQNTGSTQFFHLKH